MNMDAATHENAFTLERHGGVTVVVVSAALQTMDLNHLEGASTLLLEPIRDRTSPLVLFDLEQIPYFGSAFLGLMLRCWKYVSTNGGAMALSGVSPAARDLLRITALDTVWPIYDTRREGLEALLAD